MTKRSRLPKPPPIPEAEVLRSAKALLEGLGFLIERRQVGMIKIDKGLKTERVFRTGATSGAADLWGIAPDGRHVEIEIKRRGKRPTWRQLAFLRRMNNRVDTIAFWIDNTETLERVARHIMAGGSIEYIGQTSDYDLYREGEK